MKTIDITGRIGLDTRSEDVVAAFDAAAGEPVKLRIASEGGSVFDGLRMLGAMRKHDGPITAEVDYAFSMAANIAIEAAEIRMAEDGWLMWHEVSTVAAGGEAELRRSADMAGRMNDHTSRRLGKALGEDPEVIRGRLAGEIWMDGTEASALGIVAELLPAVGMAAMWDPEEFQQLPAQLCLDCAELSGRIEAMSKLDDLIASLGFGKGKDTPEPEALAEAHAKLASTAAELELATDALAYAKGRIDALEADIATARKGAQAEAYRILAAAGHAAVDTSGGAEKSRSLADQYKELSEAVARGEKGAAKARAEFRQKHLHALSTL